MINREKVIEVKDITKKFKVYYDKSSQLKERILFRSRNKYEERLVLRGISFDIMKGEAVGLIGNNGCGKSTTLKLLTKIMYPDSGTIKTKGRISSLIELGAGFHPDMSGRENIYTNAAIFGLTKKEIDARFDDIIAFSELDAFLDNPIRTYSSGMYMRLAFSVAINVDADILLIDEILAVGDANFQAKCFAKLREMKAWGVTIVIVTHDTGTIERFCDKAIWISEGEIKVHGPAQIAVDEYLRFMNSKKLESMLRKEQREKIKMEPSENIGRDDTAVSEQESLHFGTKEVVIEKVIMRNRNKETNIFENGDNLILDIHYKVNKQKDEIVVGMGFYTVDGVCILGNNTQIDRMHIPVKQKTGKIKFEVSNLPLLEGQYSLNVSIVDQDGTPMDFYREYCNFIVISKDRSVGLVSIKHTWEVEEYETIQ